MSPKNQAALGNILTAAFASRSMRGGGSGSPYGRDSHGPPQVRGNLKSGVLFKGKFMGRTSGDRARQYVRNSMGCWLWRLQVRCMAQANVGEGAAGCAGRCSF